jgi:hypothetical protein
MKTHLSDFVAYSKSRLYILEYKIILKLIIKISSSNTRKRAYQIQSQEKKINNKIKIEINELENSKLLERIINPKDGS